MPPRTPLSISQWSNSVHYSRMARPTTPIEIPHRHRASVNMSSSSCSAYPEIFDMSPVSTVLAESHHAHRNNGQDRFLYHLPTYPSQRNNATPSPRSRSRLQPQQKMGRSSASPPSPAHAHMLGQPSPRHSAENKNPSPSQTSGSGSKLKQLTPVTIVGFTPMRPSPSSPSHHIPSSSRKKPSLGRVRLSPPPVSFSYSSNPWILPGRGDTIEAESDEVGEDAETGDYEFDKHLMTRINGHLPLQRFGKPSFSGANHT